MLSSTKRTQIKKGAHKAVSEVEKLHAIIDESLIAHIAITNESGPVVIPMLAWRVGEFVYIHGANNSRLLRTLKQGDQTCLTLHCSMDGYWLALRFTTVRTTEVPLYLVNLKSCQITKKKMTC